MNIIPLNFSYRKLYKIACEFAEKYEYDQPTFSIDVKRVGLVIDMHFYNSPIHREFSCYYTIVNGNDVNYESFSKFIEQSFKDCRRD